VAQGTVVYLSLTAQDGKATTIVIDEKGKAGIPFLSKGKYVVSLSMSSPVFTKTKYPKTVLVEWLSIDQVKKSNIIIDNIVIPFRRDTSGILLSGQVGKILTIDSDGAYSTLCKTHISPIYTKENK
jgi:ribosomal protein L35AE/L33A